MPEPGDAPTRTGSDRPVAGASDAANRRAMSAEARSVQIAVVAVSLNRPCPTVRLSGCGTIAIAGVSSAPCCTTVLADARVAYVASDASTIAATRRARADESRIMPLLDWMAGVSGE